MSLASSVVCFLGFLFLRSAGTKLRDLKAFTRIASAYPLIGRMPERLLRLAIPTLELILGALLLTMRGTFLSAALSAGLAFVLAGSAAISARMRKGESRFACGCGNSMSTEDWAPGMLVRNGVLIAIMLFAAASSLPAAGWLDLAGGMALLVAWDLVCAAILQEGRLRAWKARG